MAFDRAPRFIPLNIQTGPNVSPVSYQKHYCDSDFCKTTNKTPFLSCSSRKPPEPKFTMPGPNIYYPKYHDKIVGGASMLFTEPRFRNFKFPTPGPQKYDPYHLVENLTEDENEFPSRLKGYLYHCKVPYTLVGYMPTIPNLDHVGYKILNDKTLVECCVSDTDTTLGPAFYSVNFDTFTDTYKGCYWSRDTSRRKFQPQSITPGVGSYDIEPKSNPLKEYLNKYRQERRKNECSLRYIDQLVTLTKRNNYPAPNQYEVGKVKCIKVKKKLVPKKLKNRATVSYIEKESPGPGEYDDPRTAFDYSKRPSGLKGLSAFLTRAPRFKKNKGTDSPAPNQYNINSCWDSCKKVSPYAVRSTAFDSSIPKKLYYLPPDYIPVVKKRPCKCSEKPPILPGQPKVNPTSSFASKTGRFKIPVSDYKVSPASYNIIQAFNFTKNPRSFRRVKKYNFLTTQKRFGLITNFLIKEDKSYVPLMTYDLCKTICRSRPPGGLMTDKRPRFPMRVPQLLSPLDYVLHPSVASAINTHTFNVTLTTSSLTSFQKYRLKLRRKHPQYRHKKPKRYESGHLGTTKVLVS